MRNKWRWKVSFNRLRKTYLIGYFTDEVEVARAYDATLLSLVSEFAAELSLFGFGVWYTALAQLAPSPSRSQYPRQDSNL